MPKEIATFCYNYFLLKRQVAKKLYLTLDTYLNLQKSGGGWVDEQVPNTYSHYADVVMETLLMRTLPTMEKKTGLKLNPTYSLQEFIKLEMYLYRHKDRFSCEISTTLNLGGDPWPIHLEPKKNVGIPDGKKITVNSNNKGVSINLKPGDMLVYRGMELEHWREEFQGDNCTQVFLHYNNQKSKDADKNIYDRRPHLGLPSWFKK